MSLRRPPVRKASLLGNNEAKLGGMRILVVEDMFLVAEVISEQLQSCGCEVIGPVSRVDRALSLVRDAPLDGALLDVNLNGELCFPVAEALRELGIPFAFLTGYDSSAVPPEYRTIPRLGKPFLGAALARLAEEHFNRRG